MQLIVPDYIRSIKPYTAGKSLEELEREYGIEDSIKLASNENPLGPSPLAVEAIKSAAENLHRYPDSNGFYLIERLAKHLNVAPEQIVLGNGSDDIIGLLAGAFLQPGDEVVLPKPTFLMYEIMAKSVGAIPVEAPLSLLSLDLERVLEKITAQTRLIFLCNPNNPTGTIFSKNQLERFLSEIAADIIVVVDEAYAEFVRDPDFASGLNYLQSERPVVVLRTFSKAYGLAGLRMGYGVMPAEVADYLNRIRLPFNTSLLAQAGAVAALEDTAFLQKTLEVISTGLEFLYDSLEKMGLEYFQTQANFFLINVKQDADAVFKKMLHQGVIVRSMSSYDFPEYIRINVGLAEENARLINALKLVL